MRKNNKGFSMVELLAAVVVLGILMGIAIPTVTNILNDQKNKTYVEDAIRLASNMEYKLRQDNKTPVPAVGCCVAMNLLYLDNNTFNDAPYDGEYDRLSSFVIAKRKTVFDEYDYYVRLIEKTSTGAYRGVDLVPVRDDGVVETGIEFLYMDNAKDNVISNMVKKTSDNKIVNVINLDHSEMTMDNLYDEYKINCVTTHDSDRNHGDSCASIIIHSPDDTPGTT